MGKLTVQQITGLDILDWLYFNQTLVYVVMDDEVVAWFIEIVKRVNTAVAATGAADMKAEIMKHYVMCFLEILASDEHPDAEAAKLHQYNKNYLCGKLISHHKLVHSDSLSEALDIATALLDYVLSAPAVVRFRLTERCFAAEYMAATHDCFMWLVKAEVIPCAKFRDTNADPRPSHEAIVVRIGLLCEFECAKFYFRKAEKAGLLDYLRFKEIAGTLSMSDKQLVLEAGELWLDHHFRVPHGFPVFNIDLKLDKDYVVNFLMLVHLNWTRQRFCMGTSAGWVSKLGALPIMIYKALDDPRPIYIEVNKQSTDTLANAAKEMMLRYGMTIHTRSIYESYREFITKMLPRIRVYCNAIQIGPGVLAAEEEDPFYRCMIDFPWDTEKAKLDSNVSN